MKRLVLTGIAVILAVAFLGGHLLAQDAEGLMNYGAKAGLNLANASGADAKASTGWDKKFRMGLNAGFFVTYGFTDMFAIQPEFLYAMKGVKYKATSGDQTETWKVDYIEIPILLKVAFSTAGNIKPNIFAGPAIDFRISAKEKSEGGGFPSEEVKIDSLLKSTDFGIVFGAGAGWKMTKGMIFLDARYTLGLSKISKSNFLNEAGKQEDIKNNVISIDLGYAFR